MDLVPADLGNEEKTLYGPLVVPIAALLFRKKTTAMPVQPYTVDGQVLVFLSKVLSRYRMCLVASGAPHDKHTANLGVYGH